ncbi:MAG: hypothetical protein ASARMPREDX12_003350 [Alectoria sarmentosa]|nr:MAG: hypothetical protein ASARMPRED_001299 [Alectoria sarmentosa]CAD6588494.1 MAG: hypothetical protein ASARMPREDX12_003350 [Alectoria sarmentosa]
MANENRQLPRGLIEAFAGFVAGIASTLVAHPLDVIKTRLQVDRESPSQFGSSLRLVQRIVRNEGTISALYRGLTPNLVGSSLSWALYFVWYDRTKHWIQSYRGSDNDGLSYYDFFIASGTAGVLTAVATNPIWVIKTRMLSTSSSHPGAYKSTLDGTRQIYRSEGLLGFYRGLVPSLFGVSHGALQFMAYEQLKIYRGHNFGGGQKDLGVADFLALSGLAKTFAGSATYPYQVVRARLQMYDADSTYKSARDVVAQMWRKEGLAGFYKGLGPNLVRVMPSTWVTFLVYEKSKVLLARMLEERSQL